MSTASKTLLLIGPLFLSACATSNVSSDWNCAATDGLGCRTIAEIQSTIVGTGTAPAPRLIGSSKALEVQGVPMWQSEQIMKIHFAPFVDEANNYHDDGVLYTVVAPAGWARR